MEPLFNRMAVIGVGLIGGSLALDCKKNGLVRTIAGYGRTEENLKTAAALGVIDEYHATIEKAVRGADLVLLAGPIGSYPAAVREMLPFLSKNAIVTDVGSVKGRVVADLAPLLGKHHFVPAHPIAGREKSGVGAAVAGLFKGARCILTPVPATDRASLEKVKKLWEAVGSLVTILDPGEHDFVMGMVSHLPHVIAYAMVNTVLEEAGKREGLVSYAGGGFRDFTRIGASSPEMWRDICLSNREILLEQIALFEKTLSGLREMIRKEDGQGLISAFEKSRALREKLK